MDFNSVWHIAEDFHYTFVFPFPSKHRKELQRFLLVTLRIALALELVR